MIYTFFNNDLFHFKHLIILLVCTLFIVFGTMYSLKKLKIKEMHRFLLIVGIISESIKVFTYILLNEETLGGYLPKTDLPFHLCSIQLIFIGILNFSDNEKTKHFLHSFMIPTCLVGGIAALLLATSSSRNNNIIMIQYFLYHSSIIIFALYLLLNKDIEFTFKDYTNTICFLFLIFFVAIYINSILYYKNDDGTFANINFMYVVNPPESGLPYLNKNHGWGVYIVHYAFLAITVISLIYIKPIINKIKSLKSN